MCVREYVEKYFKVELVMKWSPLSFFILRDTNGFLYSYSLIEQYSSKVLYQRGHYPWHLKPFLLAPSQAY
jgi:hypothetical protein